MDSAHCELVHSYVDGLQVGARNFQNFSLLEKIGQVTAHSRKTVLLQARLRGHHRRVARRQPTTSPEGQRQRGAVRARHPHVRDGHALHARHRRRARHPQAVAVPGVRRRVAPGWPARPWCRRLAYAAVAAGAVAPSIEVRPNPPAALSHGPAAADAGPVSASSSPSCASWRPCLGKKIV